MSKADALVQLEKFTQIKTVEYCSWWADALVQLEKFFYKGLEHKLNIAVGDMSER
jgi:hypothetical protein